MQTSRKGKKKLDINGNLYWKKSQTIRHFGPSNWCWKLLWLMEGNDFLRKLRYGFRTRAERLCTETALLDFPVKNSEHLTIVYPKGGNFLSDVVTHYIFDSVEMYETAGLSLFLYKDLVCCEAYITRRKKEYI